MDQRDVDRTVDYLRNASSLCVSTGAGMSAESGVPTFRDAKTGLWSKFKPEELATPEAFARNPKHVWAWYRERRKKLRDIQPHAGHNVLQLTTVISTASADKSTRGSRCFSPSRPPGANG